MSELKDWDPELVPPNPSWRALFEAQKAVNDQLEEDIKLLKRSLKALIKDLRLSKPSLEYNIDNEITDVIIDYDLHLLSDIERSLS